METSARPKNVAFGIRANGDDIMQVDDNGHRLWWSDDDPDGGWVERENATLKSEPRGHLPIGGEWVALIELSPNAYATAVVETIGGVEPT